VVGFAFCQVVGGLMCDAVNHLILFFHITINKPNGITRNAAISRINSSAISKSTHHPTNKKPH